jgi:N-acetylglucosaminyl-diphospho-decaprenol L-rhamnosyltransferase
MEPCTTVIIVNYKTASLTLQAAEAALAQPEVASVIIVDNDSGEADVAELEGAAADRDDRLRIIPNGSNVGFGRAVNLGLELVTTRFTALINSDAMVHNGCIGALVAALDCNPKLAVVGPHVRTPDGGTQCDAAGLFPTLSVTLRRTNRRGDRLPSPDWISGVMMVLPTDRFRSVGGFDPAFFMYYEDVDLCRRLRDQGYTVSVVPDAIITHLGGASHRSTRSNRAMEHAAFSVYLRRANEPRVHRWVLFVLGHLVGSAKTARELLVHPVKH